MRLSLGSVRQWHWISAAVCMVGMFMFAITGITLNHAADIPATPRVTTVEATIPDDQLALINALPTGKTALPGSLRQWLADQAVYPPSSVQGEYDGIELYVAWPGPGQDHWLAIDAELGELLYEGTDRGWIAYFNDLHKGRNTGTVWQWFIDIFSVVVIIFTITGLQLLMRQAPHKASTWPVTALGALIPVLIMLVFIH